MRRLKLWMFAALVATSGFGCSYVTSANPALTVASGEVWYTRERQFLFFFTLGSDVYYCPAGSETCYLATVR